MGAPFPSNSHPMVYFSIWKMHGFLNQFFIVRENVKKSIVWGEPGKFVVIVFPSMGDFPCVIPIVRFTSSNGKCMGFPINFP